MILVCWVFSFLFLLWGGLSCILRLLTIKRWLVGLICWFFATTTQIWILFSLLVLTLGARTPLLNMNHYQGQTRVVFIAIVCVCSVIYLNLGSSLLGSLLSQRGEHSSRGLFGWGLKMLTSLFIEELGTIHRRSFRQRGVSFVWW